MGSLASHFLLDFNFHQSCWYADFKGSNCSGRLVAIHRTAFPGASCSHTNSTSPGRFFPAICLCIPIWTVMATAWLFNFAGANHTSSSPLPGRLGRLPVSSRVTLEPGKIYSREQKMTQQINLHKEKGVCVCVCFPQTQSCLPLSCSRWYGCCFWGLLMSSSGFLITPSFLSCGTCLTPGPHLVLWNQALSLLTNVL